jgi:hypothetical protein
VVGVVLEAEVRQARAAGVIRPEVGVRQARAALEVGRGEAWLLPSLALLAVVSSPYGVEDEHFLHRLALYVPTLEKALGLQ